MIDNSCFVIDSFSNIEFEKLTERLDIDCPINSNKLSFQLKNLMFKYYPNDKKLKIFNSLHCFYNSVFDIKKSPVNYDDFNFWKFEVVTKYLTEILIERAEEDFKLSTNLEVGVNIQLNISPWDVISKYLTCATTSINEFYKIPPYKFKGKPFEVMCYQSDYKLKFYDKSRQSNLPNKNLMRYEIIYTELRKIRNILSKNKLSILTLKDINNKDSWNIFFGHLIKMYDSIKKIPMIESEISEEDIFSIHEYCNYQLSSNIQSIMNRETFKKRRASKKRIYTIYNECSENIHANIRNQILTKRKELIDIPQFQGL